MKHWTYNFKVEDNKIIIYFENKILYVASLSEAIQDLAELSQFVLSAKINWIPAEPFPERIRDGFGKKERYNPMEDPERIALALAQAVGFAQGTSIAK
jgi:hypothetical protein